MARMLCSICNSSDPPLVRCGVCSRVFCNNFGHSVSHFVDHLRHTGHDTMEPTSEFYLPPDMLFCANCKNKAISDLGFLPEKEDEYSGILCCLGCRMANAESYDIDKWRAIVSTHIDPCFFPGFEDIRFPEALPPEQEQEQNQEQDFTNEGVYYTPLPATDVRSGELRDPVFDTDAILYSAQTYRSDFLASLGQDIGQAPASRLNANVYRRDEDGTEANRGPDGASHVLNLIVADKEAHGEPGAEVARREIERLDQQRRALKAHKWDDMARKEVLANMVLYISENLEQNTTRAKTARGYSAMVIWAILDGFVPKQDFSFRRSDQRDIASFVPNTALCTIFSHFYCRRKLHYFHYFFPILTLEHLISTEELKATAITVNRVQFRCLKGKWSPNQQAENGMAVLHNSEWEILIDITDIIHEFKIYKGDTFELRVLSYFEEAGEEIEPATTRCTVENTIMLLCKNVSRNVAIFVNRDEDDKSEVPYKCVAVETEVNESTINGLMDARVEPVNNSNAVFTEKANYNCCHSYFHSKTPFTYEILKSDNSATYRRHVTAITKLCAHNRAAVNCLTSKKWNRVVQTNSFYSGNLKEDPSVVYSFQGLIRFIILGDYRVAHAFIDLYKSERVTEYGIVKDQSRTKHQRPGNRNLLPADDYQESIDPLKAPDFFGYELDRQALAEIRNNDSVDGQRTLPQSRALLNASRHRDRVSKSSPLDQMFTNAITDEYQVLSFAASGCPQSFADVDWTTPYGELNLDSLDPKRIERYANRHTYLLDDVKLRSPTELNINAVLGRARCLLPPQLRNRDTLLNLVEDLSNFLRTTTDGLSLNSSQETIIHNILSQPVTLVQGPPGCGKTFVGACLAWVFTKLYQNDDFNKPSQNLEYEHGKVAEIPVLACCPSNAAAANFARMFKHFDLIVVRVMSLTRERIAEYEKDTNAFEDMICLRTLAVDVLDCLAVCIFKIAEEADEHNYLSNPMSIRISERLATFLYKEDILEIYKTKMEIASIRAKLETPINNSGVTITSSELEKNLHEKKETLRGMMEKLEKVILYAADVVVCTCSASYEARLLNTHFSALIVDECTQATEPDTICAIGHGCSHIALLGDHNQLGPIITTNLARMANLNVSLYERLRNSGLKPCSLTVQYRMHPALSVFPSNAFYQGMLQNGVRADDRQLVAKCSTSYGFPWPDPSIPTFFWHVDGTQEIGHGTSLKNDVEIDCVEAIIHRLLSCYDLDQKDVGVVTPYDFQKCRIEVRLHDAKYGNVFVDSVDAFQGHEKDVIIFSTVRSSIDNIGFLRDARRLNVALTRCRRALIIVGNAAALATDNLWKSLIEHYQRQNILVVGTELNSLEPKNIL